MQTCNLTIFNGGRSHEGQESIPMAVFLAMSKDKRKEGGQRKMLGCSAKLRAADHPASLESPGAAHNNCCCSTTFNDGDHGDHEQNPFFPGMHCTVPVCIPWSLEGCLAGCLLLRLIRSNWPPAAHDGLRPSQPPQRSGHWRLRGRRHPCRHRACRPRACHRHRPPGRPSS